MNVPVIRMEPSLKVVAYYFNCFISSFDRLNIWKLVKKLQLQEHWTGRNSAKKMIVSNLFYMFLFDLFYELAVWRVEKIKDGQNFLNYWLICLVYF